MKINLGKILSTVSKVVIAATPVIPVVVPIIKDAINSKGKSVPDSVIAANNIANTLGVHSDQLNDLAVIIEAAQKAGILPHKDQAKDILKSESI